jgi:transcriptional regulator with XRE-family HTH domain
MEYAVRQIPNSLEYFRKKRSMSQRYIAARMGISSRSIVSDWEQGKYFPRANELFLLSVIYQTTPGELYPEYLDDLQQQVLKEDLERVTNA